MDATRWRQVEHVYHAALEKEPAARAAFLEQACAHDTSLREEVESLLSFAPGADSCLQAAVGEMALEASGGAAPSREPAATAQRLGRYELLEKIGKGGMGVVYRAKDPAIGRIVALKTILVNDAGDAGAELPARLLRESQAEGRLSHPNIVGVYDICQEGGISYIVMEYVDGRTLEEAMRQDLSLPASREAVRIVRECAAAIDYAHSQGVIHRDIKPANIMVRADGAVKIADFGIAKVSQFATLTQKATTVGSPHYMAPEQWRGEPLTGQADQYALAAVAYVLFTGRCPFESDSMAALAEMTLHREPPAANTFNAQLPTAVDRVLRKALAKTAAARYVTCSEFALALGKAWERAPARRNWMVAGAAAALVLSAAAWIFSCRDRSGTPVATPVALEPAPPKKTETAARPVSSPPALRPPQPVADISGEALMTAGKYLAAVTSFTRAIDAEPGYRSYLGRAGAYRQLGQMEKAIADYTEAIRFQPDTAAPYHDRAVCEVRLGLDKDAADDYDKALTLDQSNPRTWNGRGAIYLKKGGYKKAIECFTNAIKLDNNFVEAYQNRAKAESKLNETDSAQEDMRRAAELSKR